MYYDPTKCSVDEFLQRKSEEVGKVSPFSSILRRTILFPGMLQVHRQVMMSSIARQFISISDPDTQVLIPEYTSGLPDLPGLYLRTAFMLWEGWNLEDAVVVSESASYRMTTKVVRKEGVSTTSEPELLVSPGDSVHRGMAMGYWKLEEDEIETGYPRRDGMNLLTSGGTVPGIVLMTRKYTEMRGGATIWNMEIEVESEYPLIVGSKISNLHASKSIVSRIVPDADMPTDASGAVDLIISPYAIARRMAPSTILEIMLNTYIMELSRRMGIDLKMVVDPWDRTLTLVGASKALAGLGLDPECHRQLRDGTNGRYYDHRTLVGPMWIGRLHHHSQDKLNSSSGTVTNHRDSAVRGIGSQRLGREEVEVFLQYGAVGMIREIKGMQDRVGTKEKIGRILECLGYGR